MTQPSDVRVLPVANLKEYFRDELHSALEHQRVAVDGQTEHYVVDLLTLFSRSEALFEQTPRGPRLRPLAVMLGDALEARSAEERQRGLQRLGDVSLFVAGFFAQSFARRIVDIDYHIAMGGRAYGTLASSMNRGPDRPLARVFAELAAKFQSFVDALNELSEAAHRHSDQDILRLYELWLKTGSQRARGLLRGLGVEPTDSARSAFEH
jgi:hypothetical protein